MTGSAFQAMDVVYRGPEAIIFIYGGGLGEGGLQVVAGSQAGGFSILIITGE